MNLLATKIIFLWLLVLEIAAQEYGGNSGLAFDYTPPTAKCKASKQFIRIGKNSPVSLLQVDCSERNLNQVPDKLSSGLQVLDLTFNRLTELPAGSFSRYTSLEYLYLPQNFIEDISEDTANELSYLQALKLSDNLLKNLSRSLFKLPYLRNLYLTKNKLGNNVFDTEVQSPLTYLEVADNLLTKIPYLGPLPTLLTLNLSDNFIKTVSTEDLAPFCALKVLDLTKNDIKFDDKSCDCYHFNTWIGLRNVNVTPTFSCNSETFSTCETVGFTNKTLELYGKCVDLIETREAAAQAKITWTIVGSCVGVFFVCLLIGLYCLYKRTAKRKSRKLKNERKIAANNANTELLHSNLPDEISAKALHE